MERFFLIRYCNGKCEFPNNEHCFTLSQKSQFRCTKCVAKEVTRTWRCNRCEAEFSGFDEYYELPVPPPIAFDSPETMKIIPAMVRIEKVCKSCYEQSQITKNRA